MNKKMYWFVTILLGLVVLAALPPANVWAHGLDIEYKSSITFEIYAKYDNGQPMNEGQVTIFAPDRPSEPWLQGMTDQDGYFQFTPDMANEGNWTVRVRQAGHGKIITIPIGEEGHAWSGGTGFNVQQIALMMICIIWGFAGTALYFKRKAG